MLRDTPSDFTVGDALKLPCLEEAKVVAGGQGLSRPIASVTVMDAPGGMRWIRGREFILTAAYFLKNDEQTQHRLIEDLDGAGCSALGIKPRRFLDEIPPVMLAEADRLGLPIIEIPYALAWVDIINPVLNELISRNLTVLERSREIHRRFISLVLDGKDLEDLAADLSYLVNRPVMITDRHFAELVPGSAHTSSKCKSSQILSIPPDRLAKAWSSGKPIPYANTGQMRQAVVETDKGPRHLAMAPVRIKNTTYSYLVVDQGETGMHETDLMAVEHASTVCALEMLSQLAREEVERRFRNNFIYDLLSGNFDSPQAMIARGRAFDSDLSKPHAVMVADIDGFERYFVEISNYDEDAMQRIKEKLVRIVSLIPSGSCGRPLEADRSDSMVVLFPLSAEECSVPGRRERAVAEYIRQESERRLSPLTVSLGVGRPAMSVADMPRAYLEAREALRLGRRIWGPNRVTVFDDLGVFRVLCREGSTAEARAFHREYIGPLVEYDATHGTELVETLGAYFACRMSSSLAAKKLFIHENTMRYRLRKIQEVLGIDLDSGEAILNLWAALKLDVLIGDKSP